MGVWGTGIFQDDTASDIRNEYKDLLGQGFTGEDATRRLLESYAGSLADPDESGVVWLALAATQWKVGRLEPDTLQKALNVIDSGADLKRWTLGTKDYSKRGLALQNLRDQITSPQPPERKIGRRVLCECDWEKGELVTLKLLSGNLVILRVIERFTDKGGAYPTCELLDWIGEAVPQRSEIEKLEIMKTRRPNYKNQFSKFMVVGIKKKAAARLVRLDMKLNPAQEGSDIPSLEFAGILPRKPHEGAIIVHWKYIDRFFKEWFLFE